MVIDAHLHLWDKQHGMVNGKPVYDIGGGKSDFGGVVKQMMPAYMTDGVNSVERLIANMDFAQVNAAVVVQEYIDGNQDAYLLKCKEKYPERIKICSLYEEHDNYRLDGFDGIKICGGRLTKVKLEELDRPFIKVFISHFSFYSIDFYYSSKSEARFDKSKSSLWSFLVVRCARLNFVNILYNEFHTFSNFQNNKNFARATLK